MATYSINTGTSIQTMTYDIIGATAVDFKPVLDILKDNTDKQISPKDIRDAVLTSFSNSAFKQTLASQSNISYIGVDNINTNYANKDVKNKIFFGKRAFSGTYSYSYLHDVMTLIVYPTQLLGSGVDYEMTHDNFCDRKDKRSQRFPRAKPIHADNFHLSPSSSNLVPKTPC